MSERQQGSHKEITVDFSGLILGFSSAALSYMGFTSGIPGEKNLDLAKQNIDILDLLRVKTEGNLTTEEEKLLGQILQDLRQKYREVAGE